MKLQILVPQYQEPESVIKTLLDSIAIQQNVDLENEIGVIIVNDGSKVILSNQFLSRYPFKIQYILAPHGGVSAARNVALDAATADYVMFCDADDLFFNACALWIIFREMDFGDFDGIVSVFVEEGRTPDTGKAVYLNREDDGTFVHGKVWRREYLIDKGIRWNEKLTIHEDSYFVQLCRSLSQNVKYCTVPWYLWKWRDDSVCRHDPKYMLKTYQKWIDSNDALVDEYLRRDMSKEATSACAYLILDAYYTMNKREWIDQENIEYRYQTERRFAEYFRKHRELWETMDGEDKMKISDSVRRLKVKEGMQMESMTVDEWLRHVEGLSDG